MLSVLTEQNLCGCVLLVRGGFLARSTNFEEKKDNKHKVNVELKTVIDNKTALWHRKLKRALRPPLTQGDENNNLVFINTVGVISLTDNWVTVFSSPEPDLDLENMCSILICLMRLCYVSPDIFWVLPTIQKSSSHLFTFTFLKMSLLLQENIIQR